MTKKMYRITGEYNIFDSYEYIIFADSYESAFDQAVKIFKKKWEWNRIGENNVRVWKIPDHASLEKLGLDKVKILEFGNEENND